MFVKHIQHGWLFLLPLTQAFRGQPYLPRDHMICGYLGSVMI